MPTNRVKLSARDWAPERPGRAAAYAGVGRTSVGMTSVSRTGQAEDESLNGPVFRRWEVFRASQWT